MQPMDDDDGDDDRPLCRFGTECFRLNSAHFEDFRHPGHPRNVKRAASGGREYEALLAASTRSTLPASSLQKCKFGCGRRRKQDSTRFYDTCCRACGSRQGAGYHDDGCDGGAAEPKHVGLEGDDQETEALVLVDQALEMHKRAQSKLMLGAFQQAADLETESADALERARGLLPKGSALQPLLEEACGLRSFSCASAELEDKVSRRLLELVAVLESAVCEMMPPPASSSASSASSASSFSSSDASFCSALPATASPVPSPCASPSGSRSFRRPPPMHGLTSSQATRVPRGGSQATNLATSTRTAMEPLGSGSAGLGKVSSESLPSSQGATSFATSSATTNSAARSSRRSWRRPGKLVDSVEERAMVPQEEHRRLPDAVLAPVCALRILGLSDDWPTELTLREIRRRYMREARACHPDKGSSEDLAWRTARFQSVVTAFTTLEVILAMLGTEEGIDGLEEDKVSAASLRALGPPLEPIDELSATSSFSDLVSSKARHIEPPPRRNKFSPLLPSIYSDGVFLDNSDLCHGRREEATAVATGGRKDSGRPPVVKEGCEKCVVQ